MTGKSMRTKEQRLAHQEQIARLRLECKTTRAIAEDVGVSQATVVRDLKVVEKKWEKNATDAIDEIKARELAKLDLMEAQAWEQWYVSMTDKEKRIVEERAGTRNIKVETVQQYGDPRFMQIILSIQDRRAKLLGLDSPSKVAPTDPSGDKPYDPITDKERAERIAAILDAARDRRDREACISPEERGIGTA